MRAAVQRTMPGDLEIVDVEIDEPIGRELLIRTVASGLCHSDLHFMQGKYDTALPVVLGHEAAGIVEQVGPEVTGFRPGDHVITCLSTFCGTCEYCIQGRQVLCTRQGVERGPEQRPRLMLDGERVHAFARLGAFAEQMLVHENSAVLVRHDMPLEVAALVGCAVTTGVGAVINTARIPAGSTAAIIGCGGVGLNAVQGAALAGASRVIAIDRLAWKLDLARRFGATDVIDASEEDPVATVLELTDGGVEYSFEAIGLRQTAEQAIAMLRKGGTATIIGMIPEGEMVGFRGDLLMANEWCVRGSNMGSNHFRRDIPRFVDLYLDGRLHLDELVSRRIGLDEVNEGYAALERGEVARSVIVFD